MHQCLPIFADHDGSDFLGLQLIKVQDTIPIHSSIMSQKIALGSLKFGAEYTSQKLKTLEKNRQTLLEALRPLGTLGDGVWGGDAIYLWARLPNGKGSIPSAVKCCRVCAVLDVNGTW